MVNVNDPQPNPRPNLLHPYVWDEVLKDLPVRASFRVPLPTIQAFRLDVTERDQIGQAKYAMRLQPFNGRDAVVDAYQEAMDQTVYLKQACLEQPQNFVLRTLYESALNQALNMRSYLNHRGGRENG